MKLGELIDKLIDYDLDSEVKINVGLEILDVEDVGFDSHSDIVDIFAKEEK